MPPTWASQPGAGGLHGWGRHQGEAGARLGRYPGIGEDIVNHCINDILVQGARPLFFLDYFATANLQPEVVAEIVGGMAQPAGGGCVCWAAKRPKCPAFTGKML